MLTISEFDVYPHRLPVSAQKPDLQLAAVFQIPGTLLIELQAAQGTNFGPFLAASDLCDLCNQPIQLYLV